MFVTTGVVTESTKSVRSKYLLRTYNLIYVLAASFELTHGVEASDVFVL